MEHTYLQFVLDALDHIDGISHRAMFGGYGIYKDGYIFAIIGEDGLYFKVDEQTKPDFEAIGSKPFVYEQGAHKRTQMNYYKVPEDLLENKNKITKWVEKAFEVSKRAKKK